MTAPTVVLFVEARSRSPMFEVCRRAMTCFERFSALLGPGGRVLERFGLRSNTQ
jgi:hypothetical protein